MKNCYFILLLLAGLTASAQNLVFSDANLKAHLLSSTPYVGIAYNQMGTYIALDANNDNEISVSEAAAAYRLNIQNNLVASVADLTQFSNLRFLDVSSNALQSVSITGYPNLQVANVWGAQISAASFSNLPSLVAISSTNNNMLGALQVSNCPVLNSLQANHNALSSANIVNCPALETINLSNNQLTSFSVAGFAALKLLNVASNFLTTLNLSGAVALENLDVSAFDVDALGNPVTLLDATSCTALIQVDARDSSVQVMNFSGCANLTQLQLSHNQSLTSLDVSGCTALQNLTAQQVGLPEFTASGLTSLQYIDFMGSLALTSVTILDCPSLINFGAWNCGLTEFSIANSSALASLNLQNNNLSELEVYNCPTLSTLLLSENAFTELDLSSFNSLIALTAMDNPLTSVNLKNGSNEQTVIMNSPDLQFVCADESQVSAVQFNLANYGINPMVSSYCSFAPGGSYNTIAGAARYDENANGCDAADMGYPYLSIVLNDGTQSAGSLTSTDGQYAFYTAAGTFTLTPSFENPTYFNVTAATVTFSDANDNSATENFCITPNGVHPDAEVVIVPTAPARPGFDAHYAIIYRNKGNQTLSGTIGLVYEDDVLDFVSATQTPTTQTAGLTGFSYAGLQPFETRTISVTYNVNGPMETPAVNIDDQLDFTVSLDTNVGDDDATNNIFDLKQIVVGSYDPNDKICAEGTTVAPEKIGEYLHYVINFENTGTFAAERVVVVDELDPADFEVSSFQMLASSHAMQSRLVNNKVEFFFENIDLAPNGQGFVAFKIKSKNTLSEGDSVSNKANIFFDFNFPIETEPAVTTFTSLGLGDVSALNVRVFPNPASDKINLKSAQTLDSAEILDLQGRRLQSAVFANGANEQSLDISALSSGNYIMRITSGKVSETRKILKK